MWRAFKRVSDVPLGAFGELGGVLRQYLRLDAAIVAILLVFIALMAASSTRYLDSPQMLAAFVSDEPWLSLALEGMLEKPYGNPSNYLDPTAPAHANIPEHWGYLRYDNIIYYGGAFFEVAFPLYAALQALGFPEFPTSTVVLRLTTALASALSLLFLYNIGVRHGIRLGAVLTVLFLAVDAYFFEFSVKAHPDTLQVFFGLLALGAAIRHSERGDLKTLFALGLACGFTQGTKVGGPWTVPMAVLALWWGLGIMHSVGIIEIIKRLALLGLAALAGWVITTPYAFVDPYYFKTMLVQWSWHSAPAGGTFGRIDMALWAKHIIDYFGVPAMTLFALAALRIGWLGMKDRSNCPLVLALLLCVLQFLYYGIFKQWVMLYYLLLATAIGMLLSFDLLAAAASRLGMLLTRLSGSRVANRLPNAALICVFLILFIPAATGAASSLLSYQTAASDTSLSLERWTKEHVPPTSKILFDNYAIFDASVFKNVIQATPLTWPHVRHYDPDVIVLTQCITESKWYIPLMKSQHIDRDDPNPGSMRLYQDLFAADSYGPTPFQGIEYAVKIERETPTASVSSQLQSFQAIAIYIADLAKQRLEFLPEIVRKPLLNVAQQPSNWVAAFEMWERISRPPAKPSEGCGYRVYRINPQGSRFGRPGPLASSFDPNHPPRKAFDRTPDYWKVAKTDPVPYLGYDFGDTDAAVAIRALRVQWHSGPSTPRNIQIEWSDDGNNWVPTDQFEVAPYYNTDGAFRVDTFRLTKPDAHRLWRLVPLDQSAQSFAVSELVFESDTETSASYR